jgi:hypothetical protein
MKSKPSKRSKSLVEGKFDTNGIMNIIFTQAKAQFGDAVKGFWFYESELCPGCNQNPISIVKFKGKDSLPINGFMYRERGILIGYFLCGTCAKHVFTEAQKNPYKETLLHAVIEKNLIADYHRHLESLDA